MSETTTRPTLGTALAYKDPRAALAWLEKAFGFEPSMIIEDGNGNVVHSEMRLGSGYIMVGGEWADNVKAPASIGGANTQNVHIQVETDVDAHCERARAAGAKIVMEPETQFYGDRTYRAVDPEGHMWTVSQTVKVMTPEEWDAASDGLKTTIPG
jgi:uncharacterized glyoxalase superfamily protein PhnB